MKNKLILARPFWFWKTTRYYFFSIEYIGLEFWGGASALNKKELVSSLCSFLAGKNAEELEHWANLIEMREDIDLDEEFEKLINDIVYKLANPKLEGELTKRGCQNYLTDLEK